MEAINCEREQWEMPGRPFRKIVGINAGAEAQAANLRILLSGWCRSACSSDAKIASSAPKTSGAVT